jgi:hypothetical protein
LNSPVSPTPTAPVPTLTPAEQKYLLGNPDALLILMDYHDMQQDQADSMDFQCHGNDLRAEELRQIGAAIVKTDPECFSDEIRRRFIEPLTEFAAKRLARAKLVVSEGASNV